MRLKFQAVLQPFPSHGITDKGLLECFYRGLGPENRGIADQLCEGGLRIAKSILRVAEGSHSAFCSSVLRPEGKDQVGGKKKQSAHHREFLCSSTMSPNDLEHDDAEGWCKTAMNYTKGKIAELIGHSH
uniref:Uncharacterized protein n=1 Tax=Solanum tuberosum TaxID=4113 RepID=M1DDY2_SOLTU